MTAPPITHETRTVKKQRGPLPPLTQFVCSCGCASPESVDPYVAVIARRSHLRELGQEDEL